MNTKSPFTFPFCICILLSTISYTQVIEGGGLHSLVICSTGTVQSWGWDAYGQLGDDATLADKPTPITVSGLTGITAVAGGYWHSLALKNDGTVWSWGQDASGQLGDDATLADKPTPVQVSGLTGIIAIAAGNAHSLALKNDGTVWAWGDDDWGQLGDNATLADKPTPVQVSGLTGIIAIAGGGQHSLALKNDGTAWAWGDDTPSGQLGDDAILADKPTPVQVSGLTGITAIAAGYFHSLALKSDGTAWTWGNDGNGQLGDDVTIANKSTPVQVNPAWGGSITSIASGGYHSFALKNDNTLWSWGQDTYGQLGDDATLANKPTPVQVNGLVGITAMQGGLLHSLALKNDGTVWSWGYDGSGQLGDNATLADKSTPVQVSGACYVSLLPIELISFYCRCTEQNSILLQWATASEINNNFFTIEHTSDGVNFKQSGIIVAAGSTNQTSEYSFTDYEPHEGISYYRLKQTDYDGNYEYFGLISVNCSKEGVTIFPNPFSTQTTLQIDNLLHNATLTVDNCFGQTVAQIKNLRGQTITFNRDNLASGLYFVRLTEENKTIAIDKLVIADK